MLGGFLITAIALLFDRNSREGVHTLALFSSAVLILMLDSFLFSLMTGSQVPDDGDRSGICAIVWTQGALATGMLAAGATALFGGLGWMLASHAVNKMPNEDSKDIGAFSFLADLGGWLTFAAAMATTVILSETSIDYLHFMFGRRPDLWLTALIVTSVFVVIMSTSSSCTSVPEHCESRWRTSLSRPDSRCARSRSPRWRWWCWRSSRRGWR